MNKRESAPLGIGVSSILTVLLVLCLSLFAALTLSSARADLSLSKKNAATVSAYYAADGAATRLYAQFAAGGDQSLVTELPMSENQSLRLHLIRQADGTICIQEWRTVSTQGDADQHLPVWGGAAEGEEPIHGAD